MKENGIISERSEAKETPNVHVVGIVPFTIIPFTELCISFRRNEA